VQSGNDLVKSQPLQAFGISSPGDGRIGGNAPIVVQIYALGCGVALKGQGGDLLGREGAFELEANGKVFVFDPLSAVQAYGFVTAIEGNVTTIFKALQTVDQEYLAEFRNGIGHSGSPLRTTILFLPQGFGKSVIAIQLADILGCEQIVEEWTQSMALVPDALHLSNAHLATVKE